MTKSKSPKIKPLEMKLALEDGRKRRPEILYTQQENHSTNRVGSKETSIAATQPNAQVTELPKGQPSAVHRK